MAFCLAESLVANEGTVNPKDLADRFVRCWKKGENSVTGRCFDIGNATRSALESFVRTGRPEGSASPHSAGNGGIMRLAPAAVAAKGEASKAAQLARAQSKVTHAAAQATPYLVADADSGQVLAQDEATAPWYPASLTKLMTVYVALDAVRNGKLTLDTPLIISVRAARMPPSKMGFRPGTEVTLDNALKLLMVKSPNDVAAMVAEGVSGSVEGFADDMNAPAQRLGLRESRFGNPNGLRIPPRRPPATWR